MTLRAILPRLMRRLRGDGGARWIEAEELASRLTNGVTVIDVRGSDEFTDHLGTLPVIEPPHRLIEVKAPEDRPIILVCRTDKRSANAAAILRDTGFLILACSAAAWSSGTWHGLLHWSRAQ
jgi:rhodanese-related sulfurtransferase